MRRKPSPHLSRHSLPGGKPASVHSSHENGNVSDEQWEERDQIAKKELRRRQALHEGFARQGNAAKLHQSLTRILGIVVGDLFTRKPSESSTVGTLQDPFDLFKEQHSRHPLLSQLKIAHIAGWHGKEETLINRIRRDYWRKYLGKIGMSSITKIYKTIRRQDGREERNFAYPCIAPILQNVLHLSEGKMRENSTVLCNQIGATPKMWRMFG